MATLSVSSSLSPKSPVSPVSPQQENETQLLHITNKSKHENIIHAVFKKVGYANPIKLTDTLQGIDIIHIYPQTVIMNSSIIQAVFGKHPISKTNYLRIKMQTSQWSKSQTDIYTNILALLLMENSTQ